MLINSLIITLLVSWIWSMTTSALSISRNEGSDHELLETYQVDGGTISIYGFHGEEPVHATLEAAPACGSNAVTCDYGSHQAKVASCDALLSALRSNPGLSVKESPRDVCFDADGRCCVSWSKAVGGLTYGHLIDAAQKMRNNCVNSNNNRVSAKSDDTQLSSTCATECLSDRPSGCS